MSWTLSSVFRDSIFRVLRPGRRWLGWSQPLLPGLFSAGVMAVLFGLRLLQPLEQMGYHALFHLRGVQAWDDRLVLVAIDDDSLRRIGRFPWPRQQYARLLEVMTESDASVVVFDLLLTEPSADDQRLAEAILQQQGVILSQAWDANGAPLLPVPLLRQAALGVGHVAAYRDSDGIVRRVAAGIQGVPALAVAATQAYSLFHQAIALPSLDQPLWLNWVGPGQHIQRYSFADVVQGRIDPEAFSHKIVLVGVTAVGIDALATPFDRNPPASSVLLHATLIQNLLHRSWLRPLSTGWIVLLFLIAGPLLSGILSRRSWGWQVGITMSLGMGWVLVSAALLSLQVLPPTLTPVLLILTTGGLTSLRDRIQEAAVLRRRVRQLQDDETLKEEFFRTASHELRAPVANMQHAIALLRMSDDAADWEEYLQILDEECQQEFELINDLLDFQRLSHGQQPAPPETYVLADWLAEVVLPFKARAEANQQTLTVHTDDGTAELTLNWQSLRRIVNELLNNACKYTPTQEQIRLAAHVVDSYLECQVSNSGVVLPPEELVNIFQPFYRNVDVDFHQQGGTGLGLAILKRLVEQLGGSIQASQQLQGLTFTVRVPLAVALPPPGAELQPE
ncbi:MAG: CHASE2 domain-containing protein [Synechococcales cyanobacterium M58_A2018_015]|nr:CHASE2 domain-containing protein [Synechococcales cyanobacterium M58_A2018_015]